jgi:hypothetical protein
MSGPVFTDIPAEQWEQEYFADELKELRKADGKARRKVSNSAAAFNALIEVLGLSPEVHQPLHVFLDKTRGLGPDEEIKPFNEKDAGAMLPGDEGVADASFRKRWVRAWNEVIEPEQARVGKRFAGRRERGSIRLASRATKEKKTAPRYYSDIAQAVVDIERRADQLRGKRGDRFLRAAMEVKDSLPDYAAPQVEAKPKDEKPKSEPRGLKLAGNQTRRVNRIESAAREILQDAKRDGDAAAQTEAKRLAVTLGKLIAKQLDVEESNAFRLLADALTEAADESESVHSNKEASTDNTEWTENAAAGEAELMHTTENQNPQNTEENHKNVSPYVDEPVHVEACEARRGGDCSEACCGPQPGRASPFPDFETWLETNRERVANWCGTDEEKWHMYTTERSLAEEGSGVEDLFDDGEQRSVQEFEEGVM